jgi:hypothetical protein
LRISLVVPGVVAIVASGCEAPDSRLLSVSQPIVAGTPNTGDPAIMELLSFRGNTGARCTATLIAPNLLIAAAHCLVETPGFQRFVFPGNDDRNAAEKDMLAVKTVVANPQYGSPRQGNDFSIIVLEQPLPIRPVPLNRATVEMAQGKPVRYVGYGLVTPGNPNSGGVKRHHTAPLAQVSRLLLTIAPNDHGACQGDSGGPLLLDDGRGGGESIIGIGSFVDAPACLRNSFYQRVDTQLAWIDEQVRRYALDGGTSPPGDAGASDAGPPVLPDAAALDARPTPESDARPPAAADSSSPVTPPTPDAGGAPPMVPEPPRANPTNGATGGCGCTLGARGTRDAGGGGLVAVLLTFAWAVRRPRRRLPRG